MNDQRTRILLAALAGALVVGLAAVGVYFLFLAPSSNAAHDHAEEESYYCPMHPQVTASEPSICPICNMDLVPKGRPELMPSDSDHDGAIRLTERGRIVAAVATQPAAFHQIDRDITAPALVEIDEATEKSVTARVAGRIERLYVDRTGVYVKKGQAVAEIYSPDLVTAQQEYLIALDTKSRDLLPAFEGEESVEEAEERLVATAVERLGLLGMREQQIVALRESREVMTRTTIYANATGIVTRKGVREGAYVEEGSLLFDLVNLARVRVVASVPEDQIRALGVGMMMRLSGPGLDDRLPSARIDDIYPLVDPATRTVQVRAIFPNPGGRLKPGSYLRAHIILSATDRLSVPISAVIRTGRRNLVYVEVDENTFVPREVTLGRRSGDRVAITGGDLVEGEPVVVEGGYLIDAERQLSQGAAGGGHADHRSEDTAP